ACTINSVMSTFLTVLTLPTPRATLFPSRRSSDLTILLEDVPFIRTSSGNTRDIHGKAGLEKDKNRRATGEASARLIVRKGFEAMSISEAAVPCTILYTKSS